MRQPQRDYLNIMICFNGSGLHPGSATTLVGPLGLSLRRVDTMLIIMHEGSKVSATRSRLPTEDGS